MSTNYPQGQPERRDSFVPPKPPTNRHTLQNVLFGGNLDAGEKVTVIGEFFDGGDLGVTLVNSHVKG